MGPPKGPDFYIGTLLPAHRVVLFINAPEGAFSFGVRLPLLIVFVSRLGADTCEFGNGDQILTFQFPPQQGTVIPNGPPLFKAIFGNDTF
jgi:hypothetical protein